MKLIRSPLYLALALLTQCSSCKEGDPAPDPLPELPPATQTGARTFGCLVNGKPYVAKGINQTGGDWFTLNKLSIGADMRSQGQKSTLSLLLSDTVSFGILTTTYKILSITQIFPPPQRVGFTVRANTDRCSYDGVNTRTGTLMLTRYDPVARIAAGRFAFTLYEPGCDTLRVTDGRFDVQF